MLQPSDQDRPRCQARRQQILEAAATCFARAGFHGASIAQVSQAAGMSPGHIYHFFENKEAIIAALVERKLEHSLAMMRQFEHAEDVFQALLDRVDIGLNDKTNLDHAALEIEILAEAARNPRIAAIVRTADVAMRDQVQRLFQSARRARGLSGEIDPAVTEVITALFDGLAARVINHPDLDRAALLPVLRSVLRALL